MGRRRKYTIKETKTKKAELLDMMNNNLGILTPALKSLGIPTGVYYKWLDEDEKFRSEVNEIQTVTLDFVESKLLKLIKEGDKTAIIFYLKCKGKDRGYIEKQYIEQNTTFSEPLKLNIIVPEQIGATEQKQIGATDQKKLK